MKPTRANLAKLVSQLEAIYGSPRYINRFDPMEELISCILSQHTADANSFPTFQRLREKYPKWESVAQLSAPTLAAEIRKAGLANQKAKAILGCLRAILDQNGDYTLEPLRNMPLQEAKNWLTSLPGVGAKTAAIVLLFGFGREAIPVDTHVFRVSWRLGLEARSKGEAGVQATLERHCPPALMYRLHVALIQHGRHLCKAQRPDCGNCPLRTKCEFAIAIAGLQPSTEAHGRPKPTRSSPRPSERPAATRKGRVVRGR